MTTERWELLSAYLDGELNADERARVERWLAEDAELRATFEAMRGDAVALRELGGDDTLSEAFYTRARARFRESKSEPMARFAAPGWRIAGAAAAAVVLLAVFVPRLVTPEGLRSPDRMVADERAIAESVASSQAPAPEIGLDANVAIEEAEDDATAPQSVDAVAKLKKQRAVEEQSNRKTGRLGELDAQEVTDRPAHAPAPARPSSPAPAESKRARPSVEAGVQSAPTTMQDAAIEPPTAPTAQPARDRVEQEASDRTRESLAKSTAPVAVESTAEFREVIDDSAPSDFAYTSERLRTDAAETDNAAPSEPSLPADGAGELEAGARAERRQRASVPSKQRAGLFAEPSAESAGSISHRILATRQIPDTTLAAGSLETLRDWNAIARRGLGQALASWRGAVDSGDQSVVLVGRLQAGSSCDVSIQTAIDGGARLVQPLSGEPAACALLVPRTTLPLRASWQER